MCETTSLSAGANKDLLGLAFHPKFRRERPTSHVNITVGDDNSPTTVVRRYTVDPQNPNQADPSSAVEVIRYRQPFGNHKRRLDRLRTERRLPLHRQRRRRQRQRPRQSGAGRHQPTSRQDATHRRQHAKRRTGLPHSAQQPLRRSNGRRRNLGLRSPQSVAQQLRPRDGRLVHRRCRARSPRGNQFPTGRQPRRRELRLATPRGNARHRVGANRRPGIGRSDSHLRTRTGAKHHRRLRLSRRQHRRRPGRNVFLCRLRHDANSGR